VEEEDGHDGRGGGERNGNKPAEWAACSAARRGEERRVWLGCVLRTPVGEKIEFAPRRLLAGKGITVARVGGQPLEKVVLLCRRETAVAPDEPLGG
jgi:hypothetical protein